MAYLHMAHTKEYVEKAAKAKVAHYKRRIRKEREREAEIQREISREVDGTVRDHAGSNFPALLKRVEKDGADRLLWLLEALRKAESARLELLQLQKLKSKEQQRSSPAIKNVWVLAGNPNPRIEALEPQLQVLMQKINEALSHYRFTHTINVRGYRQLESSNHAIYKTESFGWECLGVEWLVKLASNGMGRSQADILKFRNCQNQKCGQLFYSSREGSFCSQRCYQRIYYSQDSYKKKRNAKLKDMRRIDNERDSDFFRREGSRPVNRRTTVRKRRMIQ